MRLLAWTLDPFLESGRFLFDLSRGRIAARTAISGDEEGRDGSTLRFADDCFLLSGFVDSHTHLLGVGLRELRPDVSTARSAAEALEQLAAWLGARRVDGTPLIAEGWDQSLWRDPKLPTRAELDAVTTRPLAFRRVCGHVAVFNSAALEALGTEWRDLDAESGLAREALPLSLPQLWPASREDQYQAILRAQELAFALGVTAAHEMGNPDCFRACQRAEAEGRLHLRIRHFFYAEYLDAIEQSGLQEGAGSARLKVGGIKFFLDGSFGGRSAALRAPYADGGDGLLLWEDDRLTAALERAQRLRFRVALHAIGDRAIEQALSVVETLGKRGIDLDHPRIEHAEMLDPALLPRLDASGFILSMQPNFTARWQGPGELYEQALGADRARRLNPFRPAASRPRLLFGSDTMPMDPLLGLRGALGHPREEDRLSLREALLAYSYWPRWYGHDDLAAGGLAPGDRADLTLLRLPEVGRRLSSADGEESRRAALAQALEARDPAILRDAATVATWSGGRLVYASPDSGLSARPRARGTEVAS